MKTDRDLINDALGSHQDCKYGEVYNGMDALFRLTRVVKLWRNEECHLAGDPPKYTVQGYPGYQHGEDK